MKWNRNRWRAGKLVGVLLCGLASTFAVRADVPITITATIIEPTCSVTDVNGKSQTEVDFKEVLLDAIGTGGGSGIKVSSLLMKVTCDGEAPTGKMLKMYINPTGGTMSYASRTILGTSLPGLGIELLDEHASPLPLKTWTPVVTGSGGLMSVGAGLVSENVAGLKGGAFTSTASVVMAYQ
ncbi:fimbrial protein [Salmonella enterica]|nr:fimbrial protein [Salmonella enterica]EBA9765167.1 fimbrial protein [Salmonella enterica]EEB5698901.1 fimbrial protein [Salmonella enterica]EGX5147324.1 fimbrial protein [Salmonella enterica]EHQ9355007.1 fimbrial protein [Salmonella enterica]